MRNRPASRIIRKSDVHLVQTSRDWPASAFLLDTKVIRTFTEPLRPTVMCSTSGVEVTVDLQSASIVGGRNDSVNALM